MGERFVGRWKDRTASRRLCRPYRVLFAGMPLFSIMIFALLRTEPTLIGAICDHLPTRVQTILRVVDATVLPRSLMDFETIDEQAGTILAQATFLSETLLAMGGVISIALALTRVHLSGIIDDFSGGQFWIRFVIAFCCLAFRPARFSDPSIVVNYVDTSGLFLIREGVVIAVGYYHVALMLTDALGRMTGRSRRSALSGAIVIAASHDGMEP